MKSFLYHPKKSIIVIDSKKIIKIIIISIGNNMLTQLFLLHFLTFHPFSFGVLQI